MHDRFPSKSRTKPQGDHEVGGASCSSTNGGPSNVNVELLDSNGNVVSSVLTSVAGSCSIINIIPGWYILRASHNDLNIEVKGSTEVELGFGNIQVDDIFFVSGYDICGSVVAQVTLEEVGLMLRALRYSSDVHIYVASDSLSSLSPKLTQSIILFIQPSPPPQPPENETQWYAVASLLTILTSSSKEMKEERKSFVDMGSNNKMEPPPPPPLENINFESDEESPLTLSQSAAPAKQLFQLETATDIPKSKLFKKLHS
ncbi:hypothetical protein Tco_1137919 [Tanacetum coccineum]